MENLWQTTSHARTMKARMARNEPFTLTVSKSEIDQYNEGVKQLQSEIDFISRSKKSPPLSFFYRQLGFFVIRALSLLVVLYTYSPYWVFLGSVLQFLLLPYSLFVSIGYGLVTAFMLFGGHVCFRSKNFVYSQLKNTFEFGCYE